MEESYIEGTGSLSEKAKADLKSAAVWMKVYAIIQISIIGFVIFLGIVSLLVAPEVSSEAVIGSVIYVAIFAFAIWVMILLINQSNRINEYIESNNIAALEVAIQKKKLYH